MGDRRPESPNAEQLTSIRANEAIALFQAGQAGRTSMQTGLGVFLSVAAIAATAAAATKSADVLLPLPAFLLLLAAYVFQQYIDVTVLGRARLHLESLVNADLSKRALIYESAVANLRKRKPLSRGNRALQLSLMIVGSVAICGTAVIAGFAGNLWIAIGYGVVTALAAIPAVISFSDMIKAPRLATDALLANETNHEMAVLIPGPLYREVLKQGAPDESPDRIVERILRKGLGADGL